MASALTAGLVVLLAILVGLMHLSRNLPPIVPGSSAAVYDIEHVTAPVASGFPLRFLSTLLTRTFLGDSVCKFLLNDNGAQRIRALASTISLPPLSFPVRAAPADSASSASSTEEYLDAAAAQAAANSMPVPAAQSANTHQTTSQLHRMFKQFARTPTEHLELVLQKIQAARSRSFSFVDVEGAMQAAAAATARFASNTSLSIFDGVPVAFKDMMCVKGFSRIDGGSVQRAGVCESDDVIAARFREAGAVILGTTIMTEHGVSPLGWNARWQAPVNPHDPTRYSGGSSGGSAVAVVSGFAPIAIGYDGGGSIRLPCALSGCVGLAATFGRIAFDGDDLMSTMIKAGPMGRTLEDVKLAYALLSPPSPNPTHFYNSILRVPAAVMHGQALANQRIGIFSAWFDDIDDEVKSTFRAAVSRLSAAGATIVEVELPNLRTYHMAHGLRISAEFSLALDSAFHGTSAAHPSSAGEGLEGEYSKGPVDPDELEWSTRIQVAIGNAVSGVDLLACDKVRAHALAAWEKMFIENNLSAFILPTAGSVAPEIGAAAAVGISDSGLSMKLTKHIFMANFIGVPAITVPFSDSELPLGMQVVGTHWGEADLFEVAEAIEARIGG